MANTTVIIPTLLRSPHTLQKNIDILLKQNVKLIIIDNSQHSGCKKYEQENIKVYYFPENIGVNPAWNLGVANTQTEYYLLLNDDCIVWDKVIEVSENILSDPVIGLLTYKTINNMDINLYETLITGRNKSANLVIMDLHSRAARAGWFMFGRKSQYNPIPDELKIFFGDDILYKQLRKKGLRTVEDQTHFLTHFVSTTVNGINAIPEYWRKEEDFYYNYINKNNLQKY